METTKQNQKPLNIKEDIRAKAETVLSDLRLLEPSLYEISQREEGWQEDIGVAKLQLRSIALSCKTYLNWMRDIEIADKRKSKKQQQVKRACSIADLAALHTSIAEGQDINRGEVR